MLGVWVRFFGFRLGRPFFEPHDAFLEGAKRLRPYGRLRPLPDGVTVPIRCIVGGGLGTTLKTMRVPNCLGVGPEAVILERACLHKLVEAELRVLSVWHQRCAGAFHRRQLEAREPERS